MEEGSEMTDRFWLYESRHGDEKILTPATREGWDYLLTQMAQCNGMSLAEFISEFGEDNMEGSFEEGYLYLEEGGNIEEISLTATA